MDFKYWLHMELEHSKNKSVKYLVTLNNDYFSVSQIKGSPYQQSLQVENPSSNHGRSRRIFVNIFWPESDFLVFLVSTKYSLVGEKFGQKFFVENSFVTEVKFR